MEIMVIFLVLLGVKIFQCRLIQGLSGMYLADNGSDDNNGSEQYPYATIQKAINNANEQDVIHVEAGYYIRESCI